MLGKKRNGYVGYHMLFEAPQPLYVRHLFLTNPAKIAETLLN